MFLILSWPPINHNADSPYAANLMKHEAFWIIDNIVQSGVIRVLELNDESYPTLNVTFLS